MAIELITGRAGTPHVDSADVGALNAALFGAGAYVLEGIDAELVDANNVRVSAGEMLCEGRHIRITGDGETLTIDNGTSAYKRHDIIAAKYLRGEDGVETVTLVVVKGSNSTNAPQDPAMPRQGKVIDGAAEAYWPLYRIVVDGLTPQTPAFIAQRQALYQLGLGTEIPIGADLNDYTVPGTYWHESGLEQIANVPGGSEVAYVGFKLVVEDAVRPPASTGANIVTQTLYFRGDSTLNKALLTYKRNYYAGRTGDKFSPWICTAGIDSIVAEGTTNGWAWVKYANGNAQMYYKDVVSQQTYALSAQGWSYQQDNAFSLPFPIVDNHTVIPGFGSSSAGLGCSSSAAFINNSTIKVVAFFPSSAAMRTYDRSLFVTGRWK